MCLFLPHEDRTALQRGHAWPRPHTSCFQPWGAHGVGHSWASPGTHICMAWKSWVKVLWGHPWLEGERSWRVSPSLSVLGWDRFENYFMGLSEDPSGWNTTYLQWYPSVHPCILPAPSLPPLHSCCLELFLLMNTFLLCVGDHPESAVSPWVFRASLQWDVGEAGTLMTRYCLIHPAWVSSHSPQVSLSLTAVGLSLNPPATSCHHPTLPLSPTIGPGGSHQSRTFNGSCSVFPLLDFTTEKAMAPHSSTLAWKTPCMEEPGRLQSMGWRRVGHDWATSLSLFIFLHWRRKWQPTPVFLPGESQERGSLLGCHLWGHRVRHDWSDLAAAPDFTNWAELTVIYQLLIILIQHRNCVQILSTSKIWNEWSPCSSDLQQGWDTN